MPDPLFAAAQAEPFIGQELLIGRGIRDFRQVESGFGMRNVRGAIGLFARGP